ncbi:hypothetical protein ACQKWADRAFT_328614 [Trichoderma austrokoningii]
MKFTTVVSLLAGSALAAPADIKATKPTGMSANASSMGGMRLADMFDVRQMAVLKVLSEHQQELGMSQQEKQMMDAFMAALHGEAAVNAKRQAPAAAPDATALNSLDGATDALTAVDSGVPTGVAGAVGEAASGVTNTAAGAPISVTDILNILKSNPVLAALLGNVTGAAGGLTGGLGGLTGGLGNLTGGLTGNLTGGLGNLTGGLGGLTGGLGNLTGGLGGLNGGLGGLLGVLGGGRGGLLGGILIPGIL